VSGPVFLLFYLGLTLAANFLFRSLTRAHEAAKPARFMEIAKDPYLVAYLRDGRQAAVYLAVFSLVDRGLLKQKDSAVRRTRDDVLSYARRPIEQAVLSNCVEWTEVSAIEKLAGVEAACLQIEKDLGTRSLLADSQVFSERFPGFVVMLGSLVGVALARIFWALANGRHNIAFLVILAVIGSIALTYAWRRRRTGLGDVALDRLKVLFANLKVRAGKLVPGGKNNDAVLTAAVFGMAALPAASFPYLQSLFPKPKSGDSSDSGSDSGSSDGGGGCGGGGCGGGCGG
jgi:uncharacterized protein (TIGR04222 family)